MTSIATSNRPQPLPKLRITRRGRLVLTITFALVGSGIFGIALSNSAIATAIQTSSSFEYVTVEPGQSLWDLANSIAPNSDPRDVIAELSRLNGLQSSTIHPGEQLAVPAKYSK